MGFSMSIILSLAATATPVVAIPQMATSTAATTNSTEVTATSSMSSITPSPVTMKDINGHNFTCPTIGDSCSRDVFGGVGDHLPENQTMEWQLLGSLALQRTIILPTNVSTVTETCTTYSGGNQIKCPPSDRMIKPGSTTIKPPATPTKPPYGCNSLEEWQNALICQNVKITNTTSASTATVTVREPKNVEFFYIEVRPEFPSGKPPGYITVQRTEEDQRFSNLTEAKEKPINFHYFHFAGEGRLRGILTNGVDHSSMLSQVQWYHVRYPDTEIREEVGPIPILLAQENAGFSKGELGRLGYEEIWGRIEGGADWNQTPIQRLTFDSTDEDKHPYKQLVRSNTNAINYIATTPWADLYKGGNLPKEELEKWELVVGNVVPKPKEEYL